MKGALPGAQPQRTGRRRQRKAAARRAGVSSAQPLAPRAARYQRRDQRAPREGVCATRMCSRKRLCSEELPRRVHLCDHIRCHGRRDATAQPRRVRLIACPCVFGVVLRSSVMLSERRSYKRTQCRQQRVGAPQARGMQLLFDVTLPPAAAMATLAAEEQRMADTGDSAPVWTPVRCCHCPGALAAVAAHASRPRPWRGSGSASLPRRLERWRLCLEPSPAGAMPTQSAPARSRALCVRCSRARTAGSLGVKFVSYLVSACVEVET